MSLRGVWVNRAGFVRRLQPPLTRMSIFPRYQEEYHKRLGKRHPLDKGPDGKEQPETDKTMAFEYVGCFGSESMLPKDKVRGDLMSPSLASPTRFLSFSLLLGVLSPSGVSPRAPLSRV